MTFTRLRVSSVTCLWLSQVVVAQSTSPAVFVANNVSDQISSLVVDPDGTLSLIDNIPSADGPQCIAISPDGRHIAVGHGTANSVSEIVKIYHVEADATLTDIVTDATPDSPLDVEWLNDDAVAFTETDTGGLSRVHVYALDVENAALTLIDTESTGSFNTHLALRPGGELLYANDSTGLMISWFQVAPDGELSFGGSISTAPVYAIDFAFTSDGGLLYSAGGISSGGHNVHGFSVAPNGALAPLAGSPFNSPGTSPAHVIVSPDDAWLFVGHGTDATVRSFGISLVGSIAATGFSFDVGLQGTLGDLAVLPDLLFVTDESTATDGITGVYSFDINANGSLSQNGPITLTTGVRPETMAVWNPLSPPCTGDVNGDDVVDPADLALQLGSWGACAGCPADQDGDDNVGPPDLALLLGNWGPCG